MIPLTVGICTRCGKAFRVNYNKVEKVMFHACCGTCHEFRPSQELLDKCFLMYGNESFFKEHDVDGLSYAELIRLKEEREQKIRDQARTFRFALQVRPWIIIPLVWLFFTAIKFSVPYCGAPLCLEPTRYQHVRETGSARTSMGRTVSSYEGGRDLYCDHHQAMDDGWLWRIIYFPGYILSFPCDWPRALGAEMPTFDYVFRWMWSVFLVLVFLRFTVLPNLFGPVGRLFQRRSG